MSGHEERSALINLEGAVALCAALLATAPALAEGGRWYTQEQVERGGGDALVRTVEGAAGDRATRYLRQRFPKADIGAPEETPVEGLVLVKAAGQYVYLTADGRHALVGSLLDLETGANLTEAGKGRDRLAALAAFPDADRVIFPARGEERARVTVFTDTSCGYCRKLHRELPRLQGEGVTVTYVPFPRSGPSGPAYTTMRRVWCSPDRSRAMDIAKGVADGELTGEDCIEADAVAAGYELGIRLGVNGTPAIVLPDGRLQPGYLPADRLLATLGLGGHQATLQQTR
jgi:thiol:disulfide interchange protein DsbC